MATSRVSVGFDVGIRNLGMAVVKLGGDGRLECLMLDLIDLNSHKTADAVETLVQKLNAIFVDPETSIHIHMSDLEFANIEQQPEQQHVGGGGNRFGGGRQRDNTQMKSIAHAIQAYFLAMRVPVSFISPRSKMLVYQGPPVDLKSKSKDKYYLGKRMSIEHAKLVLADTNTTTNGQEWIEYIRRLDKKDDVCDAFLQCCYALQNSYVGESM